jgi:hypothetical protein
MSKRTKITFDSINKGKYTMIDPAEISNINSKIKEAMTPIIRDFEKKQFDSWIQSTKKLRK